MTRTEIAVLMAIVLAGLLLRLVPWLRDPAIALRDDAAYHERVVRATVAAGRVPESDPLSEPPRGRRLSEHLPLGLYLASAVFHQMLYPLDHAPVRAHLIVFIALSGALIAVPVHLATRALGTGVRPALLAAAIAVCLPAHLHRTFGHWVRYDAPGTLMIALHVAFALRAIQRSTRGSEAGAAPRWRDAVLSAVFLILAAAVWRVSLLIPVIEAAYVLLVVCVRGADRRIAAWFGTVVLSSSAAFAVMDPMRSQGFVLMGAWVFVIGAALAAAVSATRSRPGRGMRVGLAGVAIAIAFVPAALAPGPYDTTLDLLGLKLAQVMNLPVAGTPRSHLLLDVIELYSLTPAAFVIGPQQFFTLGPWFVAAPFVAMRRSRIRATLADALVTPHGLLVFLAATLSALTLLLSRNKVLLAPWVAVACGLVSAQLFATAPEGVARAAEDAGAARRHGRGSRARPGHGATGSMLRTTLAALFTASVVSTIGVGAYLAWSRTSHADPALEAAATFLREETPDQAIVATPWWYGYDVQALAGRATLTDGLLESRENQRRILELYGTFLERDPAVLAAFGRAHRVTHVLVPPPDEFTNIAWVADPPMAARIAAGRNATADELALTMVRMMRREPVEGFDVAYENDRFRVLSLAVTP